MSHLSINSTCPRCKNNFRELTPSGGLMPYCSMCLNIDMQETRRRRELAAADTPNDTIRKMLANAEAVRMIAPLHTPAEGTSGIYKIRIASGEELVVHFYPYHSYEHLR